MNKVEEEYYCFMVGTLLTISLSLDLLKTIYATINVG